MTLINRMVCLFFVLALAPACKTEAPSSENTTAANEVESSAPKEENTNQIPPGQPFPQAGDFAGSHILVTYKGGQRANPNVTRTKEEALEKAKQLTQRLQEEPGIFEDMAKLESDGPSGPKGGSLGVFRKGAMVKPFEEALAALEIGAITSEPVETPFGYHIIRRNGLEELFWGADLFVVAWKGPRTPPTVTRTQEEAKVIADSIKEKLTDANFEELAKEHNDLNPGAYISLGAISKGNAMSPEMLETLKGLKFGQATGYLELPFGFTFLRRTPVEQRAGSHILISYKGAQNAKPTITRTKEEAKARAQELIAELNNNATNFAEFAKQHSEGPSGPRGGSLGTWFKGNMVPAFEEAIDGLKVGDITSECVETPFGFHIILREETK